jgi:hypothetical protein
MTSVSVRFHLFDSVKNERDGSVSGGPYTEAVVQSFSVGKLYIFISDKPNTYIITNAFPFYRYIHIRVSYFTPERSNT